MSAVVAEPPLGPTSRWTPMRMHPERHRLLSSPARHRLVAAGRGSGKTEDGKRIILVGDKHHRGAMNPPYYGARFFIAGPTRDQVKDIWWADLKALCPPEWLRQKPNETELRLEFVTGSSIKLLGLDVPERGEGVRYAGGIVTETQKIKEKAWTESLEPTLYKIGHDVGWSLREGRPHGRNHFWRWWNEAKNLPDHDSFHWASAAVMDPEMIEAARRSMDERTFAQEFEAAWLTLEGLAYSQWNRDIHLRKLSYDPNLPLIFAFDFNASPGVAAVIQEQACSVQRCGCGAVVWTGEWCKACRLVVPPVTMSCVIAEVHIARNSNTPAVCNRLAKDWGHHRGTVLIHGDATGVGGGAAQTEGTNWDLVRKYLAPHFQDLRWRVGRSNPHEIERVANTNWRLKNAAGQVHFAVDPDNAPNVVRDFEGVTLLEGGSGELDKKADLSLSHLTDAIGYYLWETFRVQGAGMRIT